MTLIVTTLLLALNFLLYRKNHFLKSKKFTSNIFVIAIFFCGIIIISKLYDIFNILFIDKKTLMILLLLSWSSSVLYYIHRIINSRLRKRLKNNNVHLPDILNSETILIGITVAISIAQILILWNNR